MNKEALLKACASVGGQQALANKLGLRSQGTIQGWLKRGRPPAERVIEIENITGISRRELRPDLYPN